MDEQISCSENLDSTRQHILTLLEGCSLDIEQELCDIFLKEIEKEKTGELETWQDRIRTDLQLDQLPK